MNLEGHASLIIGLLLIIVSLSLLALRQHKVISNQKKKLKFQEKRFAGYLKKMDK